jgi:hypothetical protein
MRWCRGRREAGGEGEAEASGERTAERVRTKCEHNRYTCRDCGGAGMCEHNSIRSQCKDCRSASICGHIRQRHSCKDCGQHLSA